MLSIKSNIFIILAINDDENHVACICYIFIYEKRRKFSLKTIIDSGFVAIKAMRNPVLLNVVICIHFAIANLVAYILFCFF